MQDLLGRGVRRRKMRRADSAAGRNRHCEEGGADTPDGGRVPDEDAPEHDDFGSTRFVIATPDLIGVYTLETGTLVIPGESRGPCEAGAHSWSPAFAGERSLVGWG